MKKYRKILLQLLCLGALFSGGCKAKEASGSAVFFDTIIRIDIQGEDDQKLIDGALSLCREYENTLSTTVEGSDIYRINHAQGAPVEVSEETISLIEKSLEYSRLSGGKFDITIAPLSSLWNFGDSHAGNVPSEKEIREALSHVGYEKIVLEGNTVSLTDPKAQIDLGGIAKGYIADRLKEYLKDQGVEHALINLGGNVLALGGKENGADYQIGIQKPFDEQGTAMTVVKTKEQSVVSSGVYERYFRKDDKLYHHILDPFTGYPYDNDLLGVTIVSEASVDGDALSTTCFALGLQEGMKLIQNMNDGTRAIFITKDYAIHDSRKES